MVSKLRTRNGIGALAVAFLWALTLLPVPGQAASEADLSISYIGLNPGSNQQDLTFTVYNVGIGPTPATQASFQVTKPNPGVPTTLPVPALNQNQSANLVYHLAAPCTAGTVVHASVAFQGDAHPNDNTIDANACSPDLQIVIVGFAPGSLGSVQLDVKNIGPVRSTSASASVQTETPTPPYVQTYSIPPLDPGGEFPFLYSLGGNSSTDCDGHKIKAVVSLSTDADLSNNTAESTLCAPKPPPPTPTPVPPLNKPGVYTDVPYDPSWILSYAQYGFLSVTGIFDCHTPGPSAQNTDFFVGWSECYGGGGYDSIVTQTAVRFDPLPLLRQIPNGGFLFAKLTFNEQYVSVTDGNGNSRLPVSARTSCVTTVGLATTDWVAQDPHGLFPNDTIPTSSETIPSSNSTTPSSSPTREFDVSPWIADILAHPDNPTLNYGFVLRGGIEQLNGDDNSSCISTISNIKFRVTYVVPDQH